MPEVTPELTASLTPLRRRDETILFYASANPPIQIISNASRVEQVIAGAHGDG